MVASGMRARALLVAVVLASTGCAARGVAPSSPPAQMASERDAAPCLAGSFAVRARGSGARLYRSTEALEFVHTASGLMLVHADIVGEWTQIEFAGTRAIARRRGASRIAPGPGYDVDLALGTRWVYTTTMSGVGGREDIVLGDLHDAAALRQIDVHPARDSDPRVAVGHDGGSALVWTRSPGVEVANLRFALVDAEHRVTVVRDIPCERPPIDVRLLRTPGGFALLYTEWSPSPRATPKAAELVLTLLDRVGEPIARRVLFAGEMGGASAAVTASGIGVIFSTERPRRALYLRTDLDGAIVTPARPIYSDPDGLASIDPAALAYHRGWLWSILHVQYVGEHHQMARPRALLVAVDPEGRAVAPIALSRASNLANAFALGAAGDALVAAWFTGPRFIRTRLGRLHLAELRCVGEADLPCP